MEKKTISQAVILRLPRYYNHLELLLEEGQSRISSGELSRRMGLTASQVRQDFNNFGGFGQQGYGYNVQNLHDEIGRILDLEDRHDMVIVGAGHLGQALAKYSNFQQHGFYVQALFDKDPLLSGNTVGGIPVLPMEELETFIRSHVIRIAVLCIPKSAAEEVLERLLNAGIKGIWNFAHVDLDTEGRAIVENIHLSESLMRLSYKLSQY